MTAPIFYINLDKRTDRRRFMERQFANLGLEATRISATTTDELTEEQLYQYCDATQETFIAPPPLCCSLSHLAAWRAILESGAPYGLVFEDDAVLSERLPAFLNALPEQGFELVRLEAFHRRLQLAPPLDKDFGGIRLRRFRGYGMGASGYIISRKVCERLLNYPGIFRRQVDIILFFTTDYPAKEIDVLLADPALCIQLGDTEGMPHYSSRQSDLRTAAKPASLRAHIGKLKRSAQKRWLKFSDPILHPGLESKRIRFDGDALARAALFLDKPEA